VSETLSPALGLLSKRGLVAQASTCEGSVALRSPHGKRFLLRQTFSVILFFYNDR
jgi:hypothetical protein